MARHVVDLQGRRHYHERARAFFEATRLPRGDVQAYREAPALLAVHAAISLTDAIQLCYTGKRQKAEAHTQAAKHVPDIAFDWQI